MRQAMRTFILWNRKKEDDFNCVDAYDSMDALHRTKQFYEQFKPLFGEFELEYIAEVPPVRICTSASDRIVRVSMGMQESPTYRERIFYDSDSIADLAGFVAELECEQLEMARRGRDREKEREKKRKEE